MLFRDFFIKLMSNHGAKIKITNITLVLKPILISMIQRTGEIEKALIAKGYTE